MVRHVLRLCVVSLVGLGVINCLIGSCFAVRPSLAVEPASDAAVAEKLGDHEGHGPHASVHVVAALGAQGTHLSSPGLSQLETSLHLQAPKNLPPVEPGRDPIDGFPDRPPCELAPTSGPPPQDFPTFRGEDRVGNTTRSDKVRGFRARRLAFSSTSRDITLANSSGWYQYATSGLLFSMHGHTILYEAITGRRLAMFTKTLLSMHYVYEVAAYVPVCDTQAPQSEEDEGVPLYPAFRFTVLFGSQRHFVVERYKCDGSLEHVWDIVSRTFFSLLSVYDVLEKGTEKPVATIDEAYFFTWTPQYNLWATQGVNLDVFAMTAALVDIFRCEASSSSSGSSSSKSSK